MNRQTTIALTFAAFNLLLALPVAAQDIAGAVSVGNDAASKLINVDGPLGAIVVGEALFILGLVYLGWKERVAAAERDERHAAALKEARDNAARDLKERNDLMVTWVSKLADVVATNTAANSKLEQALVRSTEAITRSDAMLERFVERSDKTGPIRIGVER